MTDLQKAKAALELMLSENNDTTQDCKEFNWTRTAIKDGYYYGQFEMQKRLTCKLEQCNKFYFADTAYELQAVGTVKTSWNKTTDYGKATLKFNLVKK
jgi:hypothetical protein